MRVLVGLLIYDSNNSGGRWWLKDADWEALETAGWTVHWKQTDRLLEKSPEFGLYSDDLLRRCPKREIGWLGTFATSAAIETDDPRGTIREWERVTGQSASDVGCNCCGPPHNFEYREEGRKPRHFHAVVSETTLEEW